MPSCSAEQESPPGKKEAGRLTEGALESFGGRPESQLASLKFVMLRVGRKEKWGKYSEKL